MNIEKGGIVIKLKKACHVCGKEKNDMIPIAYSGSDGYAESDDDSTLSGKYICQSCLRGSYDFGVCRLCDNDVAYYGRDLKNNYCKGHLDEVTPSDSEEAEDWESYGEYWEDH